MPRQAQQSDSDPRQPGAVISLRIEDINHEGQGIGHSDGLTVFVEQTVPGDRVEAVIERRHPRYATARLSRLFEPSGQRIEPDCPVAAECGGCTMQAVRYDAQLQYKQQQVENALNRIGHLSLAKGILQPIAGMEDPWHYRSKAQFPVAGSWEHPQIGFYASRSHEVVDSTVCRIQYPVVDAIRETVRHHIRTWRIDPYRELDGQGLFRHLIVRLGYATGDIMVIFVLTGDGLPGQHELVESLRQCVEHSPTPELPPLHLRSVWINTNRKKTNVIMGPDSQLIDGDPWIEEEILGVRSRISPQAFFQVNPRQTTVLYQTVMDMADLHGNEQILDLYCGTGSITLQLAREAGWVLGIESHPAAIADARINAELNGMTHIEFTAGRTEDMLPAWLEQGVSIDLVVLDPPRKGCEPAVIDALIKLQAPRIIYVSCNPATLARDLALLHHDGYQVQRVQPVDMFPWTGHVETVVLMSRVK